MCRFSCKKSLSPCSTSYLKLFHRFLKRSDLKKQEFSWQNLLQKFPWFLWKSTFQLWCFAPLQPRERIWRLSGGVPFLKEKSLACAGWASILRLHVLGGEKLDDAEWFSKMHHKISFQRRMNFWVENACRNVIWKVIINKV